MWSQGMVLDLQEERIGEKFRPLRVKLRVLGAIAATLYDALLRSLDDLLCGISNSYLLQRGYHLPSPGVKKEVASVVRSITKGGIS